ncbi:hypothetical protein C8R44DRAFT_751235 [Mycena epipterygia]|nr:hypothetical protein C8R44DRAFT_751235 [Mycena epipterygia]
MPEKSCCVLEESPEILEQRRREDEALIANDKLRAAKIVTYCTARLDDPTLSPQNRARLERIIAFHADGWEPIVCQHGSGFETCYDNTCPYAPSAENPAEEDGVLDEVELALKRGMAQYLGCARVLTRITEVLTLGPLGPISAAAREWLARNEALVATLRGAEIPKPQEELVTVEERKARGQRLVAMRKAGLAKKLAQCGVSKAELREADIADSVVEVRRLLLEQAVQVRMRNTTVSGVAQHERSRSRVQEINERLQRESRAIRRGIIQRQWHSVQASSRGGVEA